MNGTELISATLADLNKVVSVAVAQQSEELQRRVRHGLAAAEDNLENIRSTNNFMVMTINRCIDFTKAGQGE